jgi:hypothetical protein
MTAIPATPLRPGWPRCSFLADAAGDPLEGTAAPADRWLLLEHRGPWGRDGYKESGLDGAAVRALSTWAERNRGRVTLIRRPGRGLGGGARRWFRIDSRPGRESIRTGSLVTGRDDDHHPDDQADLDVAAATEQPGQQHREPLFLVCTHGRHDTCCAVRGRPLAAALAADQPDGTVWECSHLGGCRFAPTAVLLPHGFVLGNLPAAELGAVARAYRQGMLMPQWVRGRCSLPAAAQAAQQHARLATGALGVDALRPVDLQRRGEHWQVRLADPDCSVLLTERQVPTDRPLTCAAGLAGREGSIRGFHLVRLDLPGGSGNYETD